MLWSLVRVGFQVIYESFSTKFDVRIALGLRMSDMCLVMIFEFLSQLWSNSNLSVGNCPIYPKQSSLYPLFNTDHLPYLVFFRCTINYGGINDS